MHDLLLYFCVVAISSAVFLPLHIVLSRARRGGPLVTALGVSIALSAVAGGAFGAFVIGGSFSSSPVLLVASVGGALTFAGFAGVYALILPISVDRSLSAHIVSLLYASPGGRIREAELFRLYTHSAILGKRLRECEQSRILEKQGDELVVTAKGRRIASIYFTLDRLMHTGAMIAPAGERSPSPSNKA
ncbi:MAG: hypothetical protein JSR24_00770 [Proteobacteria bacterium]|nr:hypothetical protein [Pseudomonadota bacterium]